MKNERLKRQLRKEILILRSQVYRTEIRREASALVDLICPPRAEGPSWTDGPLWSLLTSGKGRISRWLRWGKLASRFWPLLAAAWRRHREGQGRQAG